MSISTFARSQAQPLRTIRAARSSTRRRGANTVAREAIQPPALPARQ
jgi:hypothetical protein